MHIRSGSPPPVSDWLPSGWRTPCPRPGGGVRLVLAFAACEFSGQNTTCSDLENACPHTAVIIQPVGVYSLLHIGTARWACTCHGVCTTRMHPRSAIPTSWVACVVGRIWVAPKSRHQRVSSIAIAIMIRPELIACSAIDVRLFTPCEVRGDLASISSHSCPMMLAGRSRASPLKHKCGIDLRACKRAAACAVTRTLVCRQACREYRSEACVRRTEFGEFDACVCRYGACAGASGRCPHRTRRGTRRSSVLRALLRLMHACCGCMRAMRVAAPLYARMARCAAH